LPINRAPFNALVDDTGNGLSGSVWNKAAIQSVILDPADAAYAAASVAVAAWQTVAFNAANFWNPAITAGMVPCNRYVILQGKTLLWMVQMAGAPGPTTPGPYLGLVIPGGFPTTAANSVFSPAALALDNGVNLNALAFGGTTTTIQFLKNAGGNWTGPGISLYFTIAIALA
jgi:hypothetical protein